MSDPIEDIIRSGKLKIELSEQEEKALEKRLEDFCLIRAAKRNDMAIDLIPEVLRPFARVEESDILTIAVPNCAIVKRRFAIHDSSSEWDKELNDWLTSIESVSFSDTGHDRSYRWRIFTWQAYHNDDEWEAVQSLWNEDGTKDLERALAIAAEVGDNRERVQEEVFFKNSQEKENTPVLEPEQKLICPLMSIADGGAYVDCKQAKCAWWHIERKQCAVLRMARGITSATDIE